MNLIVGSPPEIVYAKMATAVHPVEVENYGVGIIKFKNGVIGSLVLTNLAYFGAFNQMVVQFHLPS